jgi:hypothetical protein
VPAIVGTSGSEPGVHHVLRSIQQAHAGSQAEAPARAWPHASRSSWTTTVPSRLTQPSSLEVTEGNDSTDWELWRDSVNCFDSQLRSLQPSVELHEPKPGTPTEFEDIDVFARVRRRDV